MQPAINRDRLLQRLLALGEIGAVDGGCSRIALSDEDKAGRDLVVQWMRELDLEVVVDRIGNVIAVERDLGGEAPVMTGSHIDTVRRGGLYDGNLGVLAGLEVVQSLREAGITDRRPIAVAIFTNEEGVRYQPDMMGSLVYAGGLPLEEALASVGVDGSVLGEELVRIGYAGDHDPGHITPHAFVELHIEQGPVLEREDVRIGAVESVQGISWTEISLTGTANHAGTTPIPLRRDAGLVAARIAAELRRIAIEAGDGQVATVGQLSLEPNVINVVPGRARLTLDLRNSDADRLKWAEARTLAYAREAAADEGVDLTERALVRFAPVAFDQRIVGLVEQAAGSLGLSIRRMPSGAGHDAQMMARIAPTGMIFVPSVKGISHNVAEFTAPEDLEAGANVLLRVLERLTRE